MEIPNQNINILIAHCKKDEECNKRLHTYLNPLYRRYRNLNIWSAANIMPGAEWKQEMTTKMETAHIILLLISADSLASEYFYEEEMKNALKRHKKGEATVIPVILSACGWNHTTLSTLGALPDNGKPINKWTHEADAYMNIFDGIVKVLRGEKVKYDLSYSQTQQKSNYDNDSISFTEIVDIKNGASIPVKNFTILGESVIGDNHRKQDIPCQDSCYYINLGNNWFLSVVCDGASTAKDSNIGAKLVARKYTEEVFVSNVDKRDWFNEGLLPSNNEWKTIAKKSLKDIYDKLKDYCANTEGLAIKNLSCTIIVALIRHNGILITHIGDGRAGYKNDEGEWKPMIIPFKGKEIGTTIFLTSDIWNKNEDNYIESQVIRENIAAFTLLTDGCESHAFECSQLENGKWVDANKPYDKFFNPLLDQIKKVKEEGWTHKRIQAKWENFLVCGTEGLENEYDDKTMVIGFLDSDFVQIETTKNFELPLRGYVDSDAHNVQLSLEPFAKGGEGNIYKVVAPFKYESYCAKMYYQLSRLKPETLAKLTYMINSKPNQAKSDHRFRICWPESLLYNSEGTRGFIMPLAFPDSLPLYELCLPNLRKKINRNWHNMYNRDTNRGMLSRLNLCLNISDVISQIHSNHEYLLIDLKPQDLLITLDGRVSILDLDSVQISKDNKILYPASVATPEYMPPEAKELFHSGKYISESWTNFSLAVIFYEVLTGIHPYTISTKLELSTLQDKIKHGLFVHGRNQDLIVAVPPPHKLFFTKLPKTIRELFMRAFDKGYDTPSLRPTSIEWSRVLKGELQKIKLS